MTTLTWDKIKHFKPREFACRCGKCGSDGTEMDLEFVDKLDQLRERSHIPFYITSGYRCPAYNMQVSTTGADGPHTTGRAADVKLSGASVFRVMQQSTLGGWMTGIGLHQRGPHSKRFIHLDDLGQPHPRPRVWTY